MKRKRTWHPVGTGTDPMDEPVTAEDWKAIAEYILEEDARDSDLDGFIYFIETPDMKMVKIGYSAKSPRARLSALQTGYPGGRLEIRHLSPGTRADEEWLHRIFARERVQGEWFKLSSRLDCLIGELDVYWLHEEARYADETCECHESLDEFFDAWWPDIEERAGLPPDDDHGPEPSAPAALKVA